MSYSSLGQALLPGDIVLPGELPTGQLNVPLPGGGTYTVGGAQAQVDQPEPKEPSESTMKWTQLVAGVVGVTVGVATLLLMLRKGKKYTKNARRLTVRQIRARLAAMSAGPRRDRMQRRADRAIVAAWGRRAVSNAGAPRLTVEQRYMLAQIERRHGLPFGERIGMAESDLSIVHSLHDLRLVSYDPPTAEVRLTPAGRAVLEASR